MGQEKISPVAVGTALKSMRNTDFDMQTAICEVIDNSIQAEAKNIKIAIRYPEKAMRRKNRPEEIAFGDDGCGMGSEVLQYCLRLGYSGRYDDRKGIGRFGVGMTFAAISLCQRIEVYSRPRQGIWQYTYLDISELGGEDEPGIAPIEQKSLPDTYANLVGDFGTLVIWSLIDRADTPIKEEDLRHNLGRIYRKSIGEETVLRGEVVRNADKRNLYINNQEVYAFDPLFVTGNRQRPNDETTTVDSEMIFDWRVHEVDAPSSGETQGKITMRTSLLPESWRQVRSKPGRPGSGRSAENNRRHVPDNEGMSILRGGREVAYGQIPHFLARGEGVSSEIDRFWSCEIDFEPTLDHWFSVRNIKIGARPLTELKDELKKKILPSIMHFRTQIKVAMDEYDAKENESTQGPVFGNASKEQELGSVTTAIPAAPAPGETKKNAEKAAESVSPDEEVQKEYIEKVTNPDNRYNIVEAGNMRSDAMFFEIVPDLNTKVVHYNMNHTFIMHLYETVKELGKAVEEDSETGEMVRELKGCFDNLFHAYSEAYYDLDDHSRRQSVGDTIEELQVKWNWHLRKIYKSRQNAQ